MNIFVVELNHLQGIPHGWGNGYVIIPPGHPCYGKHYDDIDVDVHGGLTFSEYAKYTNFSELKEEDTEGWVVGFDTAHYGDNILDWPKEKVIDETENLKMQLINYKGE